MIYEDIANAIIADPPLNSIVGNRVYSRKPIESDNEAYIQISREARQRDIVSDNSRFRITCFSKDLDELEDIANYTIDLLEGQSNLSGTNYYEIAFLNQVDSDQELDNGMYFTFLDFIFKKIY